MRHNAERTSIGVPQLGAQQVDVVTRVAPQDTVLLVGDRPEAPCHLAPAEEEPAGEELPGLVDLTVDTDDEGEAELLYPAGSATEQGASPGP